MIDVVAGSAAEVPRVAALAAEAQEDAWSATSFRQELRVAGAHLWVARDAAGDVVGYLAVRRVLGELHVLSLAVATGSRRRGVGRALLERALAVEPGLTAIQLEVRAGNAVALAFYGSLGFVAVGRRPRYYRGREDAILMTRIP